MLALLAFVKLRKVCSRPVRRPTPCSLGGRVAALPWGDAGERRPFPRRDRSRLPDCGNGFSSGSGRLDANTGQSRGQNIGQNIGQNTGQNAWAEHLGRTPARTPARTPLNTAEHRPIARSSRARSPPLTPRRRSRPPPPSSFTPRCNHPIMRRDPYRGDRHARLLF